MANNEIKTLVEKLCDIMTKCKNIPKNGYNSYHKYSYVTAADAAEYIRQFLTEERVIAVPNIVSANTREIRTSTDRGEKVQFLTEVIMRYTFINAEDASDTLEVSMLGHGADPLDKAAYKANTGVHKYFLMQSFCLGGEDDAEIDGREPSTESVVNPSNVRQVVKDATQSVKNVGALFYYKVPYESKDQWNPILKRNKARFNPDSKHWESKTKIMGMDKFLVAQSANTLPSSEPGQVAFGYDEEDSPPVDNY